MNSRVFISTFALWHAVMYGDVAIAGNPSCSTNPLMAMQCIENFTTSVETRLLKDKSFNIKDPQVCREQIRPYIEHAKECITFYECNDTAANGHKVTIEQKGRYFFNLCDTHCDSPLLYATHDKCSQPFQNEMQSINKTNCIHVYQALERGRRCFELELLVGFCAPRTIEMHISSTFSVRIYSQCDECTDAELSICMSMNSDLSWDSCKQCKTITCIESFENRCPSYATSNIIEAHLEPYDATNASYLCTECLCLERYDECNAANLENITLSILQHDDLRNCTQLQNILDCVNSTQPECSYIIHNVTYDIANSGNLSKALLKCSPESTSSEVLIESTTLSKVLIESTTLSEVLIKSTTLSEVSIESATLSEVLIESTTFLETTPVYMATTSLACTVNNLTWPIVYFISCILLCSIFKY